MADRNDFKLLKQRCLRHFELAKECLEAETKKLDDDKKARYGFYFFVIQNLTNIVDYDKIIESITDTDFNSTFSTIKKMMKVLMPFVLMSKPIKLHYSILSIEINTM